MEHLPTSEPKEILLKLSLYLAAYVALMLSNPMSWIFFLIFLALMGHT